MNRSLLVTLASLALALPAVAQSSSTPVIGFYKFDAPVGTTPYSCGFVTKAEFQGAATSIVSGASASTVSFTSAWTTGQFVGANGAYYLEVIDAGPNSGLIYDITGNTPTSVTVAGDLTGLPSNTVCVIRKHATLGTVLQGGAGLIAGQDLVSLITKTGTQIDAQPNGSPVTGQQWDNLTEGGFADNLVIRPGQGFLISNFAENPVTVTVGGGAVSYVKSSVTQIELTADVPNLVGLINPLVGTGVSDQKTVAQWFNNSVLGGAASGANQIDILNPDGSLSVFGSFTQTGTTFFDFNGGSGTPGNSSMAIRNGQAVVITNASGADVDLVLPVLHP